uniref:CASP-like protein 1 n=1 Tax=Erigeron canadensis TaxID=72917 RepID=UPI001CB8AAE4|nr:CASP-like protein 1 [Erigeron canadensis]
MASVDHTQEAPLKSEGPPPEYKTGTGLLADVVLRVLLFATGLVAVIIMVTSKQTKLIPFAPGFLISRDAKFNYSPAFIYFVAALSVATLYSIITGVLSVFALISSGGVSTKMQFHFVMFDALLLGVVAAATGASGGVGYIGLKGNSHTGWTKICDRYHTYCVHFGVSIFLSLVSSIVLLLLVWLSVYTLSKKIARR